MSPKERRTARSVGLVLLAASLVRYGLDRRGPPVALPGDTAGIRAEVLGKSRASLARERARTRPLAPGERLDPNRATPGELDRLPGVGPAVARAIVEERERGGAFRTPEDLLRVRGVGPATLERIRESLDFGKGIPPELARGRDGGVGRARPGPVRDPPGRAGDGLRAGAGRIDLNAATKAELEALPGIGPRLAGRIVESRRREGPFRRVEDLVRVRGIGERTVERLRSLVRAGGRRTP